MPEETSQQQTNKAVAGVVAVLRHDFRIVGSHRVHAWYAWAIIGIVFGMALGVVYVANRSGKFLPTKASGAPVYACESTTKTEYEAIREIYPIPFSGSSQSTAIASNFLRAAVANIASSNSAPARNKPVPQQSEQTKTLLEIIADADQKALEACLKSIDSTLASAPPGECDEGCTTVHMYKPDPRNCTVTGSFENGKDAGIPVESINNAGKPGHATPTVNPGSYTYFATATAPAMTLTTYCEARSILTGEETGDGAGTGTGTGKLPDATGGSGSYNRPTEPFREPEQEAPPQPELPISPAAGTINSTQDLKAQ